MGKVGPNHWSSNQVILSTNLVTHEDKTRNHSDPMRGQTCVILVIDAEPEPISSLKSECQGRIMSLY